MTDLTEQWKKGELPSGRYYTLVNGGSYEDYTSTQFYNEYANEFDKHPLITKQVLAKVPTYEEWKQLKEYERIVTSYNMKPIDYETACETVNKLLDEKKSLKEKNAKLKELLKECRRQFEEVALYRYDVADDDQEDWFKISTEQAGIANKMITKISQALGEE